MILVDPAARWTVDPSKMATKGRNSPFAGLEFPGKVVATFFSGHPTVLDGALNTPYRYPLTPASRRHAVPIQERS